MALVHLPFYCMWHRNPGHPVFLSHTFIAAVHYHFTSSVQFSFLFALALSLTLLETIYSKVDYNTVIK